uniref:Uncharacterized protein n=1 Tax=Oryza meridionalis TaxID=40149 RepID=A0A0E0EAD6_9ORYZ
MINCLMCLCNENPPPQISNLLWRAGIQFPLLISSTQPGQVHSPQSTLHSTARQSTDSRAPSLPSPWRHGGVPPPPAAPALALPPQHPGHGSSTFGSPEQWGHQTASDESGGIQIQRHLTHGSCSGATMARGRAALLIPPLVNEEVGRLEACSKKSFQNCNVCSSTEPIQLGSISSHHRHHLKDILLTAKPGSHFFLSSWHAFLFLS